MFKKTLDYGGAGDNVGCLLRTVKRDEVQRGQVLAAPNTVKTYKEFEAELYVLTQEEGRPGRSRRRRGGGGSFPGSMFPSLFRCVGLHEGSSRAVLRRNTWVFFLVSLRAGGRSPPCPCRPPSSSPCVTASARGRARCAHEVSFLSPSPTRLFSSLLPPVKEHAAFVALASPRARALLLIRPRPSHSHPCLPFLSFRGTSHPVLGQLSPAILHPHRRRDGVYHAWGREGDGNARG
jgi:hypothetical protein